MWRDFEELESSLSMPELVATLTAAQEQQADQNKFLAALKGIKLDEGGNADTKSAEDVWNNAVAKANSNGKTGNINDIMAMPGASEGRIDLGLGQGIEVEVIN